MRWNVYQRVDDRVSRWRFLGELECESQEQINRVLEKLKVPIDSIIVRAAVGDPWARPIPRSFLQAPTLKCSSRDGMSWFSSIKNLYVSN
jgi:hypothetical protein